VSPNSPDSGTRIARRHIVLFVGCAATLVWVFNVADDILYHTPYVWGQWCGETPPNLFQRESCSLVYNYYYRFDTGMVDLGVIAAASLLVSLVCLAILWTPRKGARRAVFRTFLIVAPGEVLLFEACVYFLLNYWWTIHATGFLAGTPFTNEGLFWTSAAVLAIGVALEAWTGDRVGRHPLRDPARGPGQSARNS